MLLQLTVTNNVVLWTVIWKKVCGSTTVPVFNYSQAWRHSDELNWSAQPSEVIINGPIWLEIMPGLTVGNEGRNNINSALEDGHWSDAGEILIQFSPLTQKTCQ